MGKIQDIKVAVDAIVFGYNPQDGLSVLLIQRRFSPFQGGWALPGGLVKDDESLEAAVHRELAEESGISINYLEQLYTFGKPGRDPRNRVVSVTYFGLVKPNDFKLSASTDAEAAAWFNINDLPELAFDHKVILETAIQRLQAKVRYQPIGFELLDEKFPFSELEKLYSAILGREIDRRNFKKKVMSYGILEKLDESISGYVGRPARLFRFNRKRYQELMEKGVDFEI